MKLPLLACVLVMCAAGCGSTSSGGDVESDSANQTGGKTVLRLPLVAGTGKNHTHHVLMSSFNDKLTAGGFKKVPDSIDIDGQAAAKAFFDAENAFDDAASKLKIDAEQIGAADPSDFARRSKSVPALCYVGDAHKVPDLVLAAADSAFSDQIGIHAWRFKKEVHAVDADPAKDFGPNGDLGELPDIWKEWRGEGEAILIMTHIGDDGTDVETSVISKCLK